MQESQNWHRLSCSMFVLSSILSIIYLGQHASSQEMGISNPSIINPPPQQNSPPAYNPPPQQNSPPAYNPPPPQNSPPTDPQTSADEGEGKAEYPILQISSPLILALVIAVIAGIGGALYVLSRRYVMAE